MDIFTKAGIFGVIASAIVALVFKWQNKRLKRKNIDLQRDNNAIHGIQIMKDDNAREILRVIDEVEKKDYTVKERLKNAETFNDMFGIVNDVVRGALGSDSSNDTDT